MQIYLHFGMGFSVHWRGGAWQPASFFYAIDHAWAIKTQAVCFSFPCLQGGDDEAAESGAIMVVRLGIFGRRGMVAEMPAVLAARAELAGKGAKIDILAQGWTKWHEKDEPKPV